MSKLKRYIPGLNGLEFPVSDPRRQGGLKADIVELVLNMATPDDDCMLSDFLHALQHVLDKHNVSLVNTGEMVISPFDHQLLKASYKVLEKQYKELESKIREMVPADKWISVKDRLPEKPGFYLVMKHFNTAVDKYLNETKEYHQGIIFYFKERNVTGWQNKHDVTHWQPLPPAPGKHNTKLT